MKHLFSDMIARFWVYPSPSWRRYVCKFAWCRLLVLGFTPTTLAAFLALAQVATAMPALPANSSRRDIPTSPNVAAKPIQYWNDGTKRLCSTGTFSLFNCDFEGGDGIALCMSSSNLSTYLVLVDKNNKFIRAYNIKFYQNIQGFSHITWAESPHLSATIFLDFAPGDSYSPSVIISKSHGSQTKFCSHPTAHLGGKLIKLKGKDFLINFADLVDEGLATARDDAPDLPHR